MIFVERLRERVANVDLDSELGQWLRRAEEWAAREDPLARTRNRKSSLPLYHSGLWEDLCFANTRRGRRRSVWPVAAVGVLVKREPLGPGLGHC